MWCVRKLFNARSDAINFITYRISPRSTILLWHDPWIGHQPLSLQFGNEIVSITQSINLATVSSIIRNGDWDIGGLNHVLAIELRHLLNSCPINTEDKIFWEGETRVNLSAIWNSIRSRGTPPPWINSIWHPLIINNFAVFMWLALKNRLLTKDRMNLFGHNVLPGCVLCYCHNETAEHLFFSCPYTYLILKECPLLVSNSWNEWLQDRFFQGNHTQIRTQLGYLYISVMIYYIWRECNDRVHQNGRGKSVSQILSCVKIVVRERVISSKAFKTCIAKNPTIRLLLY